jgi:hypothetical protein
LCADLDSSQKWIAGFRTIQERGPMNELGGYAFADLRVGMCATFAKTVTEANIVLFAARAALPMDCCRQA